MRRIGSDGGEVSDAEAVLIAIPGPKVAGAFDTVHGLEGGMGPFFYRMAPPDEF